MSATIKKKTAKFKTGSTVKYRDREYLVTGSRQTDFGFFYRLKDKLGEVPQAELKR